jgi:hypothetical protein
MQKFSRTFVFLLLAFCSICVVGGITFIWPLLSQGQELPLPLPHCVDSPQAHATVRALASLGDPQIDEGVNNIATLSLWQSSCGVFASASVRRVPPEVREVTVSLEQSSVIPGSHFVSKTTGHGENIWTPVLSNWVPSAPVTACLTVSLDTAQPGPSSVCLTKSLP